MASNVIGKLRLTYSYLSSRDSWTEQDYDTAESLSEQLRSIVARNRPDAQEASDILYQLGKLILKHGSELEGQQ